MDIWFLRKKFSEPTRYMEWLNYLPGNTVPAIAPAEIQNVRTVVVLTYLEGEQRKYEVIACIEYDESQVDGAPGHA